MGQVDIKRDVTKTYTSADLAEVDVQCPKLGDTYIDVQGNEFKCVKNTTASAYVVGDVVSSTYANAVDTETQAGATAALNLMAGVAMGAIPASGFGWIQTWGYNASINTLGHASNVIGASLKAVNSQVYATFDAAPGTESTYRRHIVSLAAYTTTSAALKPGLIRCR